MEIKFSLMVSFVLINLYVFAQTNEGKAYRRLRIGDKIPDDYVFENMVNYPEGRAKISDFKGKAVILDFWNLSCGPCIASFPKMEQLQKQFENKLQILLVNVTNDWEQLQNAGFPDKSRSENIRKSKLPFVLLEKNISSKVPANIIKLGKKQADSFRSEHYHKKNHLANMFPHGGEPFHVWIDADGVIRATTYGSELVNEESISNLIQNKQSKTLASRTIELDDLGLNGFDNRSIVQPNNLLIRNSVLYSSVILKDLGVIKGVDGVIIDSATKKTVGLRTHPNGILNLYRTNLISSANSVAESKKWRDIFASNRISIDTEKPENFIAPKYGNEWINWIKSNYYTQEVCMPAFMMDTSIMVNMRQISSIMQHDLERFFGLRSYLEKRVVKCYVLIRTSNQDKLKTKGEKTSFESTPSGRLFRSVPFREILNNFSIYNKWRIPLQPLVNESGFHESKVIDMIITSKFDDIEGLKKDFHKYDLDIIEGEREIEMLVITDKKDTN